MKIRRTIAILIDGEKAHVDDIAAQVVQTIPVHNSDPATGFRYRIQHTVDFLDDNGEPLDLSKLVKP